MPAQNPEDVDRLFEQYLNAGDLENLVALYEDDGVLMVPGGEIFQGTARLREGLGGLIAGKPTVSCKVTQTLRAGDTAVCYNDWSMSAPGPDGQTVQYSGKALEVVRRQADGTWKFAIDDPNARG
jgi:uncharacterized protein (TIGR02246 family)